MIPEMGPEFPALTTRARSASGAVVNLLRALL
jgi:hypothetical protein